MIKLSKFKQKSDNNNLIEKYRLNDESMKPSDYVELFKTAFKTNQIPIVLHGGRQVIEEYEHVSISFKILCNQLPNSFRKALRYLDNETELLIKIFRINIRMIPEIYRNCNVNIEVQKAIIEVKPIYIRYIANQDEELMINLLKKFPKAIYSVTRFNERIFSTFMEYWGNYIFRVVTAVKRRICLTQHMHTKGFMRYYLKDELKRKKLDKKQLEEKIYDAYTKIAGIKNQMLEIDISINELQKKRKELEHLISIENSQIKKLENDRNSKSDKN